MNQDERLVERIEMDDRTRRTLFEVAGFLNLLAQGIIGPNLAEQTTELLEKVGALLTKAEEAQRLEPNFDQIAFDIVQRIWGNTELDQPGLILETQAVAAQLRQVWNAR